jgi:spore germination protein YaaH
MNRPGGRLRIGFCVLILTFFCSAAVAAQQGAARKGRKQVATWLVFRQEPGFDRIQRYSDILSSLSVFGDPPREFIDRCHQLNIEVYYGVSGNASAFDKPASVRTTLDKYLQACREKGYDGIDLDFEHLDPAMQETYSAFLRTVSSALHDMNKKLSHCVGYYPGMDQDPPKKIFYDPRVVGETCDLIRVMCYDFYWAPGRGDPKMVDRPDTQGIGPTSSHPWAKAAMRFWLGQVPREKLIMGLPAYSNDYALSLEGKGKQVYASRPQVPARTPMEKAWLWYERLPVYLYMEGGAPHLFYASDAESTKAHLETVDELNLPGIGFWHFSSVDEETWKMVQDWLEGSR